MEIIADASAWLSTDAENLARFLETETGKRLIPKLVDSCPALLDKGDINAILIRSGEVRAWSGMIESLLLLAHSKAGNEGPPPPTTEYPPLTDDRAWDDGQKLESSPE